MDKTPFFSIVMPAYNCVKTVGTTLESIKNQKFSDFELIVVNDGSTDQTQEVLEAHAKRDERIKVLSIQNGGPGNARNQGIKQAKGTYLLLIDADDKMTTETLGTYAQYLSQEEDIDLIVSSYEMNVLDGEEVVDVRLIDAPSQTLETHDAFLKAIYPLMNQQLMYVVWNKIFRLDIIKKNHIQFPEYKSCEDRLFNIAYFKHVNKAKIVSDILYYYSFDGKNSLTNQYLPNKFDTFVEFYQELLKVTIKNEKGSSALFLKGVMSCIIPIHSPSCPLNYREKFRYINNIVNHTVVKKAVNDSLTDTKMRLIMKKLFQTRSALINYYASKIMYIVSMASPKTIEKFKRKF